MYDLSLYNIDYILEPWKLDFAASESNAIRPFAVDVDLFGERVPPIILNILAFLKLRRMAQNLSNVCLSGPAIPSQNHGTRLARGKITHNLTKCFNNKKDGERFEKIIKFS